MQSDLIERAVVTLIPLDPLKFRSNIVRWKFNFKAIEDFDIDLLYIYTFQQSCSIGNKYISLQKDLISRSMSVKGLRWGKRSLPMKRDTLDNQRYVTTLYYISLNVEENRKIEFVSKILIKKIQFQSFSIDTKIFISKFLQLCY